MTTELDEIRRMVSQDPTATGLPDLAAIRRDGRRLRTRRRVVTGLTSLGVVAAVVVPTALVATRGPDASRPVAPATSSTAQPGWSWTFKSSPRVSDDHVDGCGSLFGCVEDAEPETGEVVGEPWPIAGSGDGTVDGFVDEVVYAVRPAPGQPAVVAVGFQDAAGLHRSEVVFRPGEDPGTVTVVDGMRHQGAEVPEFVMLGLVADDPVTTVAWQSQPGPWRRAPFNDDLVDGYAVFWLSGAWSSEWPSTAAAPVTIRVDGEEYGPPGGE